MLNIFVTGGAGFIGSAVCRHLIQKGGYRVVNVDKLTYAGNPESLRHISESPNYSFHKADICDEAAMLEELQCTGGCVGQAGMYGTGMCCF